MPGSGAPRSVGHVSGPEQVWHLDRDGHRHRVEASGSPSHHVRWFVDDELVGEKKAWEDRLTVTPDEPGHLGRVAVRFSALGKARRATLYDADEGAEALKGLGGVDLMPEEGSAAAAYEDRIRLHPRRYAAVATAGGVAKVVVPLLLGLLAIRFVVNLPWPGLPDLPFPDLPHIPWPDLPSVPLPDLPDVRVPDWVRWVLDKAKYVWPIVIAYVLARAEINRRRKQDELRRRQADEQADRSE